MITRGTSRYEHGVPHLAELKIGKDFPCNT